MSSFLCETIATFASELERRLAIAITEKDKFSVYKEFAERGDPLSQYNLSIIYREGRGIKANIKQSVKWEQCAAELGLPDAQLNLAMDYRDGNTALKKDSLLAKLWMERAAENDDEALFYLGAWEFEDGSEVKAVPWLLKAASRTHAQQGASCGLLAQIFSFGSKVHPERRKKGIQWATKGAKMNNPVSLYYLAMFLKESEPERSLRLFKLSGKQW